MPLAYRVIPTILCRGRVLVKGRQFDSWRSVGVAAQAVRVHALRGVDEICLLDIGATAEGRGPDLRLVEELSAVVFCPLAVGGGVRSVSDVRDLLLAGADKIVVGTAAHELPDFVREATDVVGSQAISVAVDVRRGYPHVRNGSKAVFMGPVEYARELERAGAGELILTAVDREGTCDGYDLDLIRSVAGEVSIPVVANGGCGSFEHMVEAIEAGANAVAAGAFFQFEDATPLEAARYLSKKGIEART